MILPAQPQNPLLLIGYDLKSALRGSRIILGCLKREAAPVFLPLLLKWATRAVDRK
jgi:hypothetical protein